MEDVAGRAKTCLIIDRVDNKTGVRVVRGQNILNLLNKEIFLFETNQVFWSLLPTFRCWDDL